MTELPLTRFVNEQLGPKILVLSQALHLRPPHGRVEFSDSFVMELLVTFLLLTLFVAIRLSMSVENPKALQQLVEMLHEFVSDLALEIIGTQAPRFISFLSSLFLFILVMNVIGCFPGLQSPTLSISVPLGIAIVTWIYYHAHGIWEQRWAYRKQFLGPVGWLTPLMLPLEINMHFTRLVSLTLRLWANMYAGELVILVFFSLIPVGLPVMFTALHLAVGILQAYLFMLLATIYLGLAVAHDH
jgi:F-type H+-transporting ATPase subunit a